MFQTRSLTTGFLVASLGIAAGLAVFGSSNRASAAGDCDALKIDVVKAVCAKGGKAAVKASMKQAVDLSGDKALKCANCHENQNDYKQKPNAESDFKTRDIKRLPLRVAPACISNRRRAVAAAAHRAWPAP